jgi:hypothetical protein
MVPNTSGDQGSRQQRLDLRIGHGVAKPVRAGPVAGNHGDPTVDHRVAQWCGADQTALPPRWFAAAGSSP